AGAEGRADADGGELQQAQRPLQLAALARAALGDDPVDRLGPQEAAREGARRGPAGHGAPAGGRGSGASPLPAGAFPPSAATTRMLPPPCNPARRPPSAVRHGRDRPDDVPVLPGRPLPSPRVLTGPGRQASRRSGQLRQRGPPRPRPSSLPRMVMTSIPFAARWLLLVALRS